MVPPLVRLHLTIQASQRLPTPYALSGEPVFPYCTFRKATPGCISVRKLTALHPPAALWEKNVHTSSLPHVTHILTNPTEFVKQAFTLPYYPCEVFGWTEPQAPSAVL